MLGKHSYGGKVHTTDRAEVYFGGIGKPGGPGHGHGKIDSKGNFVVFRDPYVPTLNAKGQEDRRASRAARDAAKGEYTPPPAAN